MVLITQGDGASRFTGNAGIAIGPILFIIAILGILAAAIAAGSGSFSSSTTKESNSTKAAALIEIGQNLRVGFDRILSYGSYAVTDIVIDPTATTHEYDLFAPTGGGIAPPSVNMRVANADTAKDVWYYPMLKITNVGDTGARVAMLHIDAGVCDQVNIKANGVATPASTGGSTSGSPDLGGDISTYAPVTGNAAGKVVLDAETGAGGDAWPSAQAGQLIGCINYAGTAGAPAGYYFYQVLGIM